jgi:DNA polymerase
MILGEAPGIEEDERGKPFIGLAGKLLWEELRSVGIERRDCFVANAVSCWPDRTPTDAEMYACRGNLYRQIKRCNPFIILALGNIPNSSLGKKEGIGEIRGEWYVLPWFKSNTDEDIWVFPTWHPAYLLRRRLALPEWRNDLREFARALNA